MRIVAITAIALVLAVAGVANSVPPTYMISGFVLTGAGSGIGGVDVVGDNGAGAAVTEADGSYSITVPNNWDGTVTVSKTGWLITPPSKTYSKVMANKTNENYTAYQPTISGTVRKADGSPLAGAVVAGNNGGGSDTTDTAGYYEFFVPYNWSGAVSVSLAGYHFTDKNYTNIIADQTNQDFTGFQPTISGSTELAGATVTFSGIGSVVSTPAYSAIVPYGWTGTVEVSLADYNFTESPRSYTNVIADQANQNFTPFQPTISGSTGVAGVTVTISGIGSVVSTPAYSAIVPYGWSGTVEATLTDYNFTESPRSYTNVIADQTDQNFTGFQPTISGSTGISGATVTFSGIGSVVSTPAYSAVVPYGWTGTVEVSLAGYNFTESPRSYTNVIADQANQDFTPFQPTISGSTGVAGVTVTFSGIGSVVSTPSYSVTVPYGWTGTVEVSLAGYNFPESPRDHTNVTANETGQDFTPYQPTISGYVRKSDGTGLAGATVTADNGGGSDTTDANGYYEIVLPYGWSGNVSAERFNLLFTPANYSHTNLTSDQSNNDFTIVSTGTITVKADGTGDVPTIQTAIDFAVNGDVVQVEDGTYTGDGNRDIDFLGKAITVRGNIADPNLVVIDCEGTETEPHRGFKFISGEDANSILEGFTITNGYGPIESSYSCGGAIYCNNSSPFINHCIIRNNKASAGGGVINLHSNPTIKYCIITENSATYDGGGIRNLGGPGPTIENCKIINNSAIRGAGISNWGTSIQVGEYVYIYITIKKCLIKNNSAASYGGGISDGGWTIANISNCVISDNSANYGAGICVQGYSKPKIDSCTVVGNLAASDGGGIHNIYSTSGEINITNSVIWNNQPFQIYGTTGAVTVSYSDIQDGYTGVGNILDNPLFIDAANGDYHLSINSPCIDAGNPDYIAEPNETDIDGDPRVVGRIDMGIDEFFANDSAALFVFLNNVEFVAQGIDSNIPAQVIEITNYGAHDLNWQVINNCDWLSVIPTIGQTASLQTTDIAIDVNNEYISYGLQSCQFQIIDPCAINSPQVVTVNLEVLRPGLSVVPGNLIFEAIKDTANPDSQILSIANTGYDTLNWQIAVPVDSNWLIANPASGQSTGEVDEVTLSVDTSRMEHGFYNCNLTVSAPNAENSPQVITVELRLLSKTGERHVPSEYQTIQAAIDAAIDGDEVIIQPGTYTGPGNYGIDFDGKEITVRSIEPENPAIVATTIVDPEYAGNGFYFYDGEDANSVLDGLTIRNTNCLTVTITGGITCDQSSPVIRNCVVEQTNGDGIVLRNSSAIISNCIVRNNGGPILYSYYGCGILCTGHYDIVSSPLITDCVISNNYGSGIISATRNTMIANCAFVGNKGEFNRKIQTSYGGGILFICGDLSVINCTFSGNRADMGGGICGLSYSYYESMNNIDVANSIFWDNDATDGPQIVMSSYYDWEPPVPSTITVSYSDVQGGEANVYLDPCSTLNWGDGNIDTDPNFADAGFWHANGTPSDANDDYWIDGDYHLKSEHGRWDNPNSMWQYDDVTSPCIDAGDPNDTGWEGELWPHGKRINMGAYGGTAQASMSASTAGNIADFNKDGFVNIEDLALFAEKWPTEELLLAEDINRNGMVNFADWAELAEQWLWQQ